MRKVKRLKVPAQDSGDQSQTQKHMLYSLEGGRAALTYPCSKYSMSGQMKTCIWPGKRRRSKDFFVHQPLPGGGGQAQ